MYFLYIFGFSNFLADSCVGRARGFNLFKKQKTEIPQKLITYSTTKTSAKKDDLECYDHK